MLELSVVLRFGDAVHSGDCNVMAAVALADPALHLRYDAGNLQCRYIDAQHAEMGMPVSHDFFVRFHACPLALLLTAASRSMGVSDAVKRRNPIRLREAGVHERIADSYIPANI